MPPGSTSTSAAAIVFDAGNTLVSVIRTVPLLVLIGCCASILWLKLGGTGVAPAILSEPSGPGTGSREDIELARIRHVSEGRAGNAEILGQHLVRRVLEPVAQQESIVFVEIAVVEHQQEFAAVRIEALDRMRNAGRKIPEIADADVIDEVAAPADRWR